MAAGGTLDGDAAVIFSWAVPEGGGKPTDRDAAQSRSKVDIPYTTSRPEVLPTLSSIQALAFSPDGTMLAVGGCDAERDLVVIYSFTSDDFKGLFASASDSLGGPSPPGRDEGPGRKAPTIRSHHLHNPKRITCDDGCLTLSWSPDSSYLAIAGNTGTVTIQPIQARYDFYAYFSAQRRACMKQVQIGSQTSRSILGLTWSRCGRFLAVQTTNCVEVYSRGLRAGRLSLKKLSRLSYLEPEVVRGILRHGQGRTPGEALTREQLLKAQAEDGLSYHFRLFLDRVPEKHSVESRRALRTMYAISLYKRSLAFSPDSTFLVCTSGFLPVGTSLEQGVQNPEFESATFCSYVFERSSLLTDGDWASPSIVLPGLRCAAVDVAFSPLLYELTEGEPNCTALPYQMLFAVVAGCDVVVYTTQTFKPIAMYRGENYQQDFLTSVAWSPLGDELCAFGGFSQYLFLRLPRDTADPSNRSECKDCASEPVYRPFITAEDRARISELVESRREQIMEENVQGKEDYIDDYRSFYTQYQRYKAGRTSKKPLQPKKPEYKFVSFSKRDMLGDKLAAVPAHLLSSFLCDYQMMPVPRLSIPDSELFSIFASVTDESGKVHWVYEDVTEKGQNKASPARTVGDQSAAGAELAELSAESAASSVDASDRILEPAEPTNPPAADPAPSGAAPPGDGEPENSAGASDSSDYEEIEVQPASDEEEAPPRKRAPLDEPSGHR